MATILITGGAGFIGSALVHRLYRTRPDDRLLVVDALTYAGTVQNLPDGSLESGRIEFYYADVCNAQLMDALAARADAVVHLAAETHVTRSIFDNKLFFETDVLGTQTVATAVLNNQPRVKRFVHLSSSEVYGTALREVMDEDHPLEPMSPYAAAKCGADRLVHSYWHTYGLPAVIVRPFNNFGPRQHLEKAVARFVTSCLLGEPLTVHGDGSAARDWLFVEDCCEALDLVLRVPLESVVGQALNLGTGTARSVREVAEAVRALSGSSSEIAFIGDRPGQVSRHAADASRAKRLLGWQPRTRFEDALEQTIAWYRGNEAWWRPQLWTRHIPILSAQGRRELH